MKKHENLGTALGRQEQKSIRGGADGPSSLMCNTTYGGAFSNIATYGNRDTCHANMTTHCYDGGPYWVCYCTGDTIHMVCQL